MRTSGMHLKSRVELGCTLIILSSENKVCGIDKNSRMELRNSILTAKSVRKACADHKWRR